MRSPRYSSSNEETQPVQPPNVPDSDPLNPKNRARTPPPADRIGLQQNTPPAFPNAPPTNGFGVVGQPGMPPFSPAPPQNLFMPPPFGHSPFMFPMQNQFAPTPVPPPPMSNSSSNEPQQSNSPPKSAASVPSTSTASTEPRPSSTNTTSKKCAPPQRVGGSMFLETPPPAPVSFHVFF
ncbi:hypothetical protein ANCCEY_04822 [Ancylostoma ceylanicum]|uniref:Uncharacterized protein n=1 Tax=Ancylostoma ceylanicum TaxID=53326 RepID=A0A0D6LW67_9BILA|nr:hypothetical protein ANCCEY_04822 [Ancylostoma ceylanicum]